MVKSAGYFGDCGVDRLFFLTQSNTLNLMLMGEEAATTLGINLTFWRRIYLIIASLITGILVSGCGMIGFVGLVIPHIAEQSLVPTIVC